MRWFTFFGTAAIVGIAITALAFGSCKKKMRPYFDGRVDGYTAARDSIRLDEVRVLASDRDSLAHLADSLRERRNYWYWRAHVCQSRR